MRYTIEVDSDGHVLLTSPRYAEYLSRYGGEGRADQLIKLNEWTQVTDWDYSQRLDGSTMIRCVVETGHEYMFEAEQWEDFA